MTTASVYLGCLMSFQVSSSHGRRPLMFDGYRIVQPCTVSSEVNRKKTLKEDTTTTKQKGKTPKKISNPRAIEPRYLLPLNHRPSFHSHPLASSSCFLYIQRQINRLFFLLFFSLRISFFFRYFKSIPILFLLAALHLPFRPDVFSYSLYIVFVFFSSETFGSLGKFSLQSRSVRRSYRVHTRKPRQTKKNLPIHPQMNVTSSFSP